MRRETSVHKAGDVAMETVKLLENDTVRTFLLLIQERNSEALQELLAEHIVMAFAKSGYVLKGFRTDVFGPCYRKQLHSKASNVSEMIAVGIQNSLVLSRDGFKK